MKDRAFNKLALINGMAFMDKRSVNEKAHRLSSDNPLVSIKFIV